jgi:uncharacterized membrane protein YphA (DoxX/SURF4 family)
MEDSMAHANVAARSLPEGVVYPAWKTAAGWVCAVLLAALFLLAGVWKLTDPLGAAARMAQALVPSSLSLVTAIGAGIVETLAAVLLLVPRFRRWGAWLAVAMLMAFMIYVGANYSALAGEECNCFPWIKRAVGPGFFIGDALMLGLALGAAAWSRKSESLRSAILILGAITVFAGITYGVMAVRLTGIKAPSSITLDGKPASLEHGRVFIFFFDPECMHCVEAARAMSQFHWKDVKLVGVATTQPQWARQFLDDTKLKAGLSPDNKLLRETFKFTDPPFGVALEHGHQVSAFPFFDQQEPVQGLKKIGFVE